MSRRFSPAAPTRSSWRIAGDGARMSLGFLVEQMPVMSAPTETELQPLAYPFESYGSEDGPDDEKDQKDDARDGVTRDRTPSKIVPHGHGVLGPPYQTDVLRDAQPERRLCEVHRCIKC